MSTTATHPDAPITVDQDSTERLLALGASDRLYRLSVEQYQKMAQVGILTKDDRIELIEGLLVEKVPRSHRQIVTTWLIQNTFRQRLPDGYFTVKGDPIILARSELEPDVAILRGAIEDYFQRKPVGNDTTLVAEVAESSRPGEHRNRRRTLYAEAGIPRYWIANLNADRIEAYSDPTGPDPSPDYRTRHDYGPDDSIPLIIEGREVARLAVNTLLAPPSR